MRMNERVAKEEKKGMLIYFPVFDRSGKMYTRRGFGAKKG